ncbi:MAG: WD40 repeat domain-containing protein [Flavobacteriales bacterium]|nr:WD40 repeat domain-containing protein [Flavobacteriales bacterium]HPF89873.1 WD40 repeat domain-containing protein [Flavobacteriales bacterium]
MVRARASRTNEEGIELSRILLLVAVLSLLTLAAFGQDDGQEYRILKVGGQETMSGYLTASLDIAPDDRTIGLSATQGFPFRTFPIDDEANVQELDIGNWYAGSRVRFSPSGKYILLQQLFYLDFAPNKDRPIKYEVVDVASGRSVLRLDDAYAAAITPDEEALLVLGKDGVRVVDISSGKSDPIKLARTGNAIAISTDGRFIAVAHRPTREEAATLTAIRNDKKALKTAEKLGQVVIIYDRSTLARVAMLDELFDKVFRLEYSPDGTDLWIHAKAHSRKGGNPNPNQSYVDVADARTHVMKRTSFPSLALFEPDFRASTDGTLFAIGSQQGRFMEVHLYDRSTGSMKDRFVLSYRLFEKMFSKAEFPSDGRLSFAFLPDGKRLLMTFGNRLIEWTYAP